MKYKRIDRSPTTVFQQPNIRRSKMLKNPHDFPSRTFQALEPPLHENHENDLQECRILLVEIQKPFKDEVFKTEES